MQELENEPIELEPNLTIKYFRLQIDTSVDDGMLYEYKSNENEKTLFYHKEGVYCGDRTLTVKIDDEKFDEQVLDMIKYFNGNFGNIDKKLLPWPGYNFIAILSNGQELKSKGCDSCYPCTYHKLQTYLYQYVRD